MDYVAFLVPVWLADVDGIIEDRDLLRLSALDCNGLLAVQMILTGLVRRVGYLMSAVNGLGSFPSVVALFSSAVSLGTSISSESESGSESS